MRLLAVLLLAAVASGCAPSRPMLVPVSLPPVRSTHLAFSLVPLNEPGWLVLASRPDLLALAKQGGNADETFAVQGSVMKFPEFASAAAFLAEVERYVSKPVPASRFKYVSHSIRPAPEKGDRCARAHSVFEDHAPVRHTSRTGHMILEGYFLMCTHPRNPAVAITVGFSQRYYPGSRDPQLEKSAETLLGSVTLVDL